MTYIFLITLSYSHHHAIHLSSFKIPLVLFVTPCISSELFMVEISRENICLLGEREVRYIKGNQHTKVELCLEIFEENQISLLPEMTSPREESNDFRK
jgi:hypothetical protein